MKDNKIRQCVEKSVSIDFESIKNRNSDIYIALDLEVISDEISTEHKKLTYKDFEVKIALVIDKSVYRDGQGFYYDVVTSDENIALIRISKKSLLKLLSGRETEKVNIRLLLCFNAMILRSALNGKDIVLF